MNIYAEKANYKIISNQPDVQIHIFNFNIFFDGRFNFAIIDDYFEYPTGSFQYYNEYSKEIGVNFGIGFQYKIRPKGLIGGWIEINYTPIDFLTMSNYYIEDSQRLKIFNLSFEGGINFQFYNKVKKGNEFVSLARYGNTRYYTIIPAKHRTIISMRLGGIAEIHNKQMILFNEAHIATKYIVFTGINWSSIHNLYVEFLNEKFIESFGKHHRNQGQFDLFADLLLSIPTMDIGIRGGWHVYFDKTISSFTLEAGYIKYRGPFLKLSFGVHFAAPKIDLNNNKTEKEKRIII